MMTYTLPPVHQAALKNALENWKTHDKVRRFWTKDALLWTGKDEGQWMGWLSIVDDQFADIDRFQRIAEDVQERGFRDILLLGMGGSSLCPEVLALSFGHVAGFPRMHVLDSTDPAQIRAIEAKIDPQHTLFFVSSKSGSTLEPNIYKQYFYERSGRDGSHFFAITDPGSKLQEVAERDGFRNVFFGVPSIGGRYSALSDFGMAPAAAMGVDVKLFLQAADAMARECAAQLAGREESRRGFGRSAGDAGAGGTRQGDHRGVAWNSRPGRVAGAVDRRIDGEDRQGIDTGGSRAAGRARGVWRRPSVRIYAAGGRCG